MASASSIISSVSVFRFFPSAWVDPAFRARRGQSLRLGNKSPAWPLFKQSDSFFSYILMNIGACKPQTNETNNCFMQHTVKKLK